MRVPRAYPASTFMSWDEWWISGGLDDDDSTTISETTSEILPAGSLSFNDYTDLFEDIHYHVMVRINETAVVFIAGQSSRNRVKMFDKEKNDWVDLPALLEGRYAPFAGLVEYSDGRRKIIVTGGSSSDFLSSTEELDLQNPQTWVPGKMDLPEAWRQGTSVQFKNTFLAIGGQRYDGSSYYYSDFIYEYDTNTDFWITRTERLVSERRHLAAFLVPDSVANCN